MNICVNWEGKNFAFFNHMNCEYFPCHNLGTIRSESFNCLFCFCPLYGLDDCGGVFTYLGNGCKDCSACIFPHRKENYGLIIERLKNAPITQTAEGTGTCTHHETCAE